MPDAAALPTQTRAAPWTERVFVLGCLGGDHTQDPSTRLVHFLVLVDEVLGHDGLER